MGNTISDITSGEGFGGMNGGLWIFAIIFLFVIFVIFFRHDRREGGIESAIPALLPMFANRHNQDGDWKFAELLKDQARDTGAIVHDNDVQMATLQRSLDAQSCEMEKSIGRVIQNQDKCAWEQERLYNQRLMDEKDEKLADMRLALSEEKSKNMHAETCARLDREFGSLRTELLNMKDRMLKAPQFLPYGAMQAAAPV